MLSSGAMNRTYSSKLATFLLLTTFLVASVGTVFGYSWCVGVDGHVEVSYVKDSGCCVNDTESRPADKYSVPGVSQLNGDSCGLCLDFTAQQYDAVFLKRVKRLSTVSVETLPANLVPPGVKQSSQLIQGRLVSLPPRVSQTILAHRTVVLLS